MPALIRKMRRRPRRLAGAGAALVAASPAGASARATGTAAGAGELVSAAGDGTRMTSRTVGSCAAAGSTSVSGWRRSAALRDLLMGRSDCLGAFALFFEKIGFH